MWFFILFDIDIKIMLTDSVFEQNFLRHPACTGTAKGGRPCYAQKYNILYFKN